MIKIVTKNIFESNASIIAHQVNTEGVMGVGLAKELRTRYPGVYETYHKICENYSYDDLIGKIQILKISETQRVANLFAESLNKSYEGDRKTDYDALRICLQKLNAQKTSIAIPYKLGCGLGGGDWDLVLQMIKEELVDCDVEICSLEPIENQVVSKETTTDLLVEYFKDEDTFTTAEAEEKINTLNDVPMHSVRGRIYDGVKKGIFKKIARGIYTVVNKNGNTTLLVNGDGRDLSFFEDNSIDCIITDHPWDDVGANKGGNRNFATYDCFRYEQKDFDEKARVLKDGCFLVEILPDENATNFDYLYQIKKMAGQSGFEYYAKLPYVKGNFVANTGRKAKNREDLMIFSKGKARALKLDSKKNKALARENGLDDSLSSFELKDLLQRNGIEPCYLSGTNGMLPSEMNHQPPAKSEKVHQAEKPVTLIEELLEYITVEGELVLDQFAGSGVVAEACLNKNRDCIAIEYDQKICEKAAEKVLKGSKTNQKVSDSLETIKPKPEAIECNEPPKLVIEKLVKKGSGYVDGKLRIQKMFDDKLSKKDIVVKLADEYGIGGYSSTKEAYGVDCCMYDSSGLKFSWHDENDVRYKTSFSWSQMYEAIKSVVIKGEYLTEKEQDEYKELFGAAGKNMDLDSLIEPVNYEQQNLFGFLNY